jgi:hypothetical protein
MSAVNSPVDLRDLNISLATYRLGKVIHHLETAKQMADEMDDQTFVHLFGGMVDTIRPIHEALTKHLAWVDEQHGG